MPLYRILSYTGADSIDQVPFLGPHYCAECRQETIWERKSGGGEVETGRDFRHIWKGVGLTDADYKCRYCQKATVTIYILWWQQKKKTNEEPAVYHFQKVGQYPAIQERIDRELEVILAKSEDLDWYSTAVRCRNFGLGLAACGYLRRVIEHRINDLIDLVIEVDKRAGAAPNTTDLETIRRSRMSDRLDFAGKILPGRLKPEAGILLMVCTP